MRDHGLDELELCEACRRMVDDWRQVELDVDGVRVASWQLCTTCAGDAIAGASSAVLGADVAQVAARERAALRPSEPRRGTCHV